MKRKLAVGGVAVGAIALAIAQFATTGTIDCSPEAKARRDADFWDRFGSCMRIDADCAPPTKKSAAECAALNVAASDCTKQLDSDFSKTLELCKK